MFKVICIDAANKPNDIPTSQWLVKDREYTVIAVDHMRVQNRILGFKLAEINLDGCFPYLYYAASRFGITQDEVERMIKEGIVKTVEPEPVKKEEVKEEELIPA